VGLGFKGGLAGLACLKIFAFYLSFSYVIFSGGLSFISKGIPTICIKLLYSLCLNILMNYRKRINELGLSLLLSPSFVITSSYSSRFWNRKEAILAIITSNSKNVTS
jgi:hypothetical protein